MPLIEKCVSVFEMNFLKVIQRLMFSAVICLAIMLCLVTINAKRLAVIQIELFSSILDRDDMMNCQPIFCLPMRLTAVKFVRCLITAILAGIMISLDRL